MPTGDPIDRLIRRLKLHPPEVCAGGAPVDHRPLLDHFPVRLLDVSPKVHGAAGRYRGDAAIFLSRNLHGWQLRAVLGHEVAHLLLTPRVNGLWFRRADPWWWRKFERAASACRRPCAERGSGTTAKASSRRHTIASVSMHPQCATLSKNGKTLLTGGRGLDIS
ncbi:MAG: hypothetical protein HY691_06265 [Chloroflexi bacterium]|nr:hypothetical protein [Chloroflexota bacterium]